MEPSSTAQEMPALMGRIAQQLRQSTSALAAAQGLNGQAPGPDCYRLLRATSTLEAAARLLRPEPRPVLCDLNGCAGALADALRALCPLRPSQLSFFSAPTPLPVGLAPALLTPALCHLACNSLQYGGPGVQLCLKTGQAGGRAYFYLADSGPGLPAGQWFEACRAAAPFSSGLGLFYCRLAAQRAGGSFFLWNRPAKNSLGPTGCASLLSFPLLGGKSCPPYPAFSFPEDRFSPYLIQLSPCCILPD